MKLTKGSLKVIVGDPEACEENDLRAQAGGRIFKPPYTIYEYHGEAGVDVHRAFGVIAKSFRPRTAVGRFPHTWAPTALKSARLWWESTDEMTLITTFEEANG